MSRMTIVPEELTQSVALSGLADETIRRIASAAVLRRYVKGAVLYRAGSPADGLYIVLSGRVRVARETADRTELLHNEDTGGVLGEIPVFGEGPFPATATALEATRCAHLPLSAVHRLLMDDPAFVRFALRRLAERARALLRRIDELTAMTVSARVASYLLLRAESSSAAEFTLGVSQEELAQELGTAREVVVRALRGLIEAGAISRTGRSRFKIQDLTTLKKLSVNS